jgi:hypothetical protein
MRVWLRILLLFLTISQLSLLFSADRNIKMAELVSAESDSLETSLDAEYNLLLNNFLGDEEELKTYFSIASGKSQFKINDYNTIKNGSFTRLSYRQAAENWTWEATGYLITGRFDNPDPYDEDEIIRASDLGFSLGIGREISLFPNNKYCNVSFYALGAINFSFEDNMIQEDDEDDTGVNWGLSGSAGTTLEIGRFVVTWENNIKIGINAGYMNSIFGVGVKF